MFVAADPFNAICFTDATYLPARITNCITGGNAGDMKCDTIVSDSTMNDAITNCLENPFATACESVSAFTTFALARTNRVSFCEIGGNESNALCMDTNLTKLCEFNIFSTACTGQPNIPNLRVASCLDANNMNKDPSCTEILLVNHADYLAIGDTPPPATVAVAIAGTDIRSHFLSVGAGGIDTIGLGDVTPVTLRLGGENGDEGDNPNGVTYVVGTINVAGDTVAESFVGLLPSTNLGAPLPIGMGQPASVEWKGRYYLGLTNATNDIDFDIDFEDGKITTDPDTQGPITTRFALDFTATGVITGNVVIAIGNATNTAEARGLIGEQGLVGGFANTAGGGRGGDLFGGFVAAPAPLVVNNAAWLASFGASPPPTTPATTNTPRHGFLQGGTDTVNFGSLRLNNGSNPVPITLNLQDATYNNVGLGGDVEDGIAYFEALIGGEGGGYAGIFSGTNLGAPLPAYVADTEPIARWNGKFGAVGVARIDNKDFTLNVNLETRKIDAFVRLGEIGIIHYKLDGDFNDKGLIINGTVSYGNFTNSKPRLANT